MSRIKYVKLSRDEPDRTIIMAGNEKVSVDELERKDSKDSKSEIKKKLTSLEEKLEE